MKPVFQSQFGKDHGNCLSAAIASVLEIPLSDVPNFAELRKGSGFSDVVQEWLAERGMFWLRIRMPRDGDRGRQVETGEEIRFHPIPECYCLATGKSPRGDFFHTVVGKITGGLNFELVHDPHLEGKGLDGMPVCIEFLVPLDPSK